jgi:hypothetical protein
MVEVLGMITVEIYFDNSSSYAPDIVCSRDPMFLFAKVAEVDVMPSDSVQFMLGQAYDKLQNGNHFWADKENVRVFNEDLNGAYLYHRSSKEGDFYKINGRVYRVHWIGFEPAEGLPDLPRFSPTPAEIYDPSERSD